LREISSATEMPSTAATKATTAHPARAIPNRFTARIVADQRRLVKRRTPLLRLRSSGGTVV